MCAKKAHTPRKVSIKNRRAEHDYFLTERFTAGIVLVGSEIKSIRLGKAGLADSYCHLHNGELWVKNLYIAEYFYATYNNHVERRERKLLLQRKELRKIAAALKSPGTTVIPIELFINDSGLAKLEIAIARGKKSYDKRATLRDKEDKRMLQRVMKHR